MFEAPAWLLAQFYALTGSYAVAIGMIAVVVMLLVTPLTLRSTKGMLEMQKIAPEMRRLQNEYRNDRQKLNEEMMKLYQEHSVNPLASCLPLLAQTPVFIIMFRILRGLTYEPVGGNALVAETVLRAGGIDRPEVGFIPRYLDHQSELYTSLFGQTEMKSLGLDLSLSPAEALAESIGKGLIYALIVVLLGGLYFFQQRMVAARATVSPTMSPGQQKLMQYLPVVFAIFQIFFLLALVLYYIVQSVLRILQQVYITRRFYGHDEALGRQAQRASEQARELAKQDGGGGGFMDQMRKQLGGDTDAGDDAPSSKRTGGGGSKSGASKSSGSKSGGGKAGASKSGGSKSGGSKSGDRGAPAPSKRTTPPKGRPTPSGRSSASRPGGRPGGSSKRKKR